MEKVSSDFFSFSGIIKKTFWIVIAFILLILAYVIFYTGAYKTVTITEGTAGPFYLFYKNHNGAYHKIVSVIEEAEKLAASLKIDCKRTFGQFLDNPEKTDQDRLKSRAGCVLDRATYETLVQSKKEVAQAAEKFTGAPNMLDQFELLVVPEQFYVKAHFEGSAGMGPMRVYPKIQKHFQSKSYNPYPWSMEIYVIHGPREMSTSYYFPNSDMSKK